MLSDSHFIDIAHIIATAGTCSRLQVGAVLVYERRIISTGYNGAPAGMSHCVHAEVAQYDQDGGGIGGGCKKAVHAEANTIAFAAKHGLSTDKASLYTTHSPCLKCAELIINAGIVEVIYDQAYRIKDGIELLEKARVHVVQSVQPGVRPMPDTRGDEPSLHPGEPANSPFDEGWQAVADAHRRRGTGV
jgi:dCMP deaminase